MTEAGVPDFEIDSGSVFAPANTPPAVVARCTGGDRPVAAGDETAVRADGGEVIDVPPISQAVHRASEYGKWIKIIHEAGIRLD